MRTEADIFATTWYERIGVDSGQVVMKGTISVHPLNPHLDELLYMGVPTPFAMVVTLLNCEEQVRQITFGECYLSDKSFSLATGVGVTTYTFVSVRVREE